MFGRDLYDAARVRDGTLADLQELAPPFCLLNLGFLRDLLFQNFPPFAFIRAIRGLNFGSPRRSLAKAGRGGAALGNPRSEIGRRFFIFPETLPIFFLCSGVMNTNERPETAKTMKGKPIMRNLRFYCTMATALAVEKPRWRRIFCSLFLVAAVVAAVGAVSSSRANQAGSTRRGEAMVNLADVKGNYPLFTYAIDDGTAETSVGRIAGGDLLCLNSFPVTGGNNIITAISIAWGRPNPPIPV